MRVCGGFGKMGTLFSEVTQIYFSDGRMSGKKKGHLARCAPGLNVMVTLVHLARY